MICAGSLRFDDGHDTQPGDRVIWLHSPGSFFLAGLRVAEIPAVVVRVCRRRIKIKVLPDEQEKTVNVDPDNLPQNDNPGPRARIETLIRSAFK
jgi:hypothetical protein